MIVFFGSTGILVGEIQSRVQKPKSPPLQYFEKLYVCIAYFTQESEQMYLIFTDTLPFELHERHKTFSLFISRVLSNSPF